jgi:hypothetical protein
MSVKSTEYSASPFLVVLSTVHVTLTMPVWPCYPCPHCTLTSQGSHSLLYIIAPIYTQCFNHIRCLQRLKASSSLAHRCRVLVSGLDPAGLFRSLRILQSCGSQLREKLANGNVKRMEQQSRSTGSAISGRGKVSNKEQTDNAPPYHRTCYRRVHIEHNVPNTF